MRPQGVSRVAPIYYRDEIRMVMPIDAFAASITSGPKSKSDKGTEQ